MNDLQQETVDVRRQMCTRVEPPAPSLQQANGYIRARGMHYKLDIRLTMELSCSVLRQHVKDKYTSAPDCKYQRVGWSSQFSYSENWFVTRGRILKVLSGFTNERQTRVDDGGSHVYICHLTSWTCGPVRYLTAVNRGNHDILQSLSWYMWGLNTISN